MQKCRFVSLVAVIAVVVVVIITQVVITSIRQATKSQFASGLLQPIIKETMLLPAPTSFCPHFSPNIRRMSSSSTTGTGVFRGAVVLVMGAADDRLSGELKQAATVRVAETVPQGECRWGGGEDGCTLPFDEYKLRAAAGRLKYDVVLVSPTITPSSRDLIAIAAEFLRNSSSLILVARSAMSDLPPLDCYSDIHTIQLFGVNDDEEPLQFLALRPLANWRVIVLGWNREQTLNGLLTTIENAEYENQSVLLEIHLDSDGPNPSDAWQKTVKMASDFLFTKGRKTVVIPAAGKKLYLRGAWWSAWPAPMRCGGNAIILEDDMRVSRFYYKWASTAMAAYQHRKDLGGVVSTTSPLPCCKETIPGFVLPHSGPKIPVLNQCLNPLWGLVPHPRRWTQHMDLLKTLKTKLTESPDGHRISVMVSEIKANQWLQWENPKGLWEEMWWFMADHFPLYTLYPPFNSSFVCNNMDAGVHYSTAVPSACAGLTKQWDPAWDNFPTDLLTLGFQTGCVS